jgi:hypothetical protein
VLATARRPLSSPLSKKMEKTVAIFTESSQ